MNHTLTGIKLLTLLNSILMIKSNLSFNARKKNNSSSNRYVDDRWIDQSKMKNSVVYRPKKTAEAWVETYQIS